MTAARPATVPEVIDALNALGTSMRYSYAEQRPLPVSDDIIVLPYAVLGDCTAVPHSTIVQRMQERGLSHKKRMISASIALRIGWAGGFEIAAFLLAECLPFVHDASIIFERGLVREIVIHDAELLPLTKLPPDTHHAAMADLLHHFALPFVETHHAWSRMSRQGLFAMLESSWASQFVAIGEKIGRSEWASQQAKLVLDEHPMLQKAAPRLYRVSAGGREKICQTRSLCCLYYKIEGASFCGSCPILPEEERDLRHRKYVTDYGTLISAQ